MRDVLDRGLRARLSSGAAGAVESGRRTGLRREVDLAVLNHADPLFLKKVTEQCQLLAGSLARLQRLQVYAFKRYQDHRPFLALERDYVRRHAADRP